MRSTFDGAFRLYRQSRYQLAIETIQSELAENPQHAPSHALWALCLASEKKFVAAEAKSSEALTYDPLCEFSNYARAIVLINSAQRFGGIELKKRTQQATEAIDEAIRIRPSEPNYYEIKAELQLGDENANDAEDSVTTGLTLDPEHAGCLCLQARMLIAQGDASKAVAVAGRALNAAPEESRTHAVYGSCAAANGETELAIRHLREALRIDPLNDSARSALVQALKRDSRIFRLLNRPEESWGRLPVRTRKRLGLALAVVLAGLMLVSSLTNNGGLLAVVLIPVLLVIALWWFVRVSADAIMFMSLRHDEESRRFISDDESRETDFTILGSCWVAGTVAAWQTWGFSSTLSCIMSFVFAAMPWFAHRRRPGAFRDSKRLAVSCVTFIVVGCTTATLLSFYSETATIVCLVTASCFSIGATLLLLADG